MPLEGKNTRKTLLLEIAPRLSPGKGRGGVKLNFVLLTTVQLLSFLNEILALREGGGGPSQLHGQLLLKKFTAISSVPERHAFLHKM